jgi:hypothetical protein
MGRRQPPLPKRRVDRESARRRRTGAGRRSARAPCRRLNDRLRDDRSELRGHRSRAHGLQGLDPTDPSTESNAANGAGGDANTDNRLNVKRG